MVRGSENATKLSQTSNSSNCKGLFVTSIEKYWFFICYSFLFFWKIICYSIMFKYFEKSCFVSDWQCHLNSTTIEGWEYPDHVPKGVSSHLTTCRIINYEVVEADFRFAAYILQNERLLRIMTIFYTLRPKPMERTQFLDDLSSCPTISPTCKLELMWYVSRIPRRIASVIIR